METNKKAEEQAAMEHLKKVFEDSIKDKEEYKPDAEELAEIEHLHDVFNKG